MELRLDGRVALVTGASKGIGRAIASAYAEAGAKVMIVSRKADALAEAAASMQGEVATYAVNAGDVEGADACVRATIERFGQLDILVNNAATNPHYGPMVDIDASKFDKTVQVNLRGPLFWTQAAWKHAMAERPGVIVNISSAASTRILDGIGVYNAMKAALDLMTRQLAYELAPTRVVGIAPGLIMTEMAQALVDATGADRAARMPVRRLGRPEDIAGLAVFLASDAASFMTGTTYLAEGGSGVVPIWRD